MDLVSRKLNLVQEFLRISDEDLVEKLEKYIRSERKRRLAKEIKPLTMKEFNSTIEKSEDDIENGRVMEARELLQKIEKWR